LLWCKIYVQNRERYDGADVNHIILKYGHQLDWQRIWMRLEQHWHLLFSQLLSFQFVYPSERDIIPRWLFDNLIARAKEQFELPLPVEKVCLGLLLIKPSTEQILENGIIKLLLLECMREASVDIWYYE
jgi:hypothetical protein